MVVRSLSHELKELQLATQQRPYSIDAKLKLAEAYNALGYPDLAAGDAYKALLLIDEVTQEGEYYAQTYTANTIELDGGHDASNLAQTASVEAEVPPSFVPWSRQAYEILITCLTDCGCLRSAGTFLERAVHTLPQETWAFERLRLEERLQKLAADSQMSVPTALEDYPEKGFARRELYPWNHFEPDRNSSDSLMRINRALKDVAPKLVVRVTELPNLNEMTESSNRTVQQLGLFAKEDIAAGEQILQERSLLTAIARLHDSYCDACSIRLPNEGHNYESIPCEECLEAFFCSTICRDLAQASYHPVVCGIDIQRDVRAEDAADDLYVLLLCRALALAETQQIHPLSLHELEYVWGDFHGVKLEEEWRPELDNFSALPTTLPFTFGDNIIRPLHILEKMGVNIFEQSHHYDTWIFNTIFAKLRGTASAQQGLDGRPEIGAVHPLWCLANHSCDPNVRWQWHGSMRFWAREELIDWNEASSPRTFGIRQGMEVLSHYCDVTLSVQERREWAIGALGGICRCSRCKFEASQKLSA